MVGQVATTPYSHTRNAPRQSVEKKSKPSQRPDGDTRQRVRSPLILAIIPGKTLAMGRAAEVGRLIGVPAGDSIDEAWFGSGCDGAGDFYAFTHPPLWTPRRLRRFSLPVWPAGAFSFEQSPLQRFDSQRLCVRSCALWGAGHVCRRWYY